MDQTKITLRIYEPVLKGFLGQIDRFFLKRDAFLNHMLDIESKYLAEDMKGLVLSKKARRYISGELGRLDTKTINVVVDKEVAAKLNDVVKQSNMVRDAFANRLLIYLRSTDAFLNWLDLPVTREEYSSWSNWVSDGTPMSPLGILDFVYADPLYDLRHAVREVYGCGLYMINLPKKMVGISCYLDDKDVPGTIEYKQTQAEIENLLKDFDSLFDTEKGE